MTVPTKLEADAIVETPKVVTAELRWTSRPSGRWYLNATVYAPEYQEVLKLHAQTGKRNYSFALLYRNYPIRKYTKHHVHPLPDGTKVREPHKHVWDEEYRDQDAYIPTDIDPQSDINDQFLDFCAECNIELVGGYQHLLHTLES